MFCVSYNTIICYQQHIILFRNCYINLCDTCLIKMDSKDVGLLALFIVMTLAVMAGIFIMDTVKVNVTGA